jgi:hypothetical protein
MNWFQANRSAATALFSVLGIALVGGGALGWQVYSEGLMRTELALVNEQITKIVGEKIFPNQESIKWFKERNKELDERLGAARGKMQKAVLTGEKVNPIDFQTQLRTSIAEMAQQAQTVGVTVPPNYAFGFAKFMTSLPPADATPWLVKQLGAAKEIVNALLLSDIREIKTLARHPIEDVLVSGGSAKLSSMKPGEVPELLPGIPVWTPDAEYAAIPFVVQFMADDAGLRNFLNNITDLERNRGVYVVRSMEVRNLKDKAPKLADLETQAQQEATATATGPDGQPVASSALGIKPILVFGQELVQATVRVDYIEWGGRPKETSKPADKPAGKAKK